VGKYISREKENGDNVRAREKKMVEFGKLNI
jgi:hypothetical protein